MVVADVGKMLLIGFLVGCVTLLAALDSIDPELLKFVIFATIGYLFGNGVNAVRKSAPSAVLTTSQDRLATDASASNTP